VTVPVVPLLECARNVARCYRFAQFVLDSGARQLLRDGKEIHVSPKAFDLLRSLVENRSRAMERTELHQQLWPDTFVLDTNLASLVAEIRRTLGDSAEDPRFVQTLHRFGYRFIAAVDDAGPADEEPVTPHVRYWLVWETRQIPLGEGANVLGRAPDAGVWIDAPGVSRNHAQITVAGRDATVEDLGSKNGTFVRGERITAPYRLADGDQIRLGSVVITFRIPPLAGSTESVQSR
jgi:DNA-binding winged helix-turn-helix (wHTH) protein